MNRRSFVGGLLAAIGSVFAPKAKAAANTGLRLKPSLTQQLQEKLLAEDFVLGLDFGKGADYTACHVIFLKFKGEKAKASPWTGSAVIVDRKLTHVIGWVPAKDNQEGWLTIYRDVERVSANPPAYRVGPRMAKWGTQKVHCLTVGYVYYPCSFHSYIERIRKRTALLYDTPGGCSPFLDPKLGMPYIMEEKPHVGFYNPKGLERADFTA